jgi:hypothetical protein
MILPMTGFAVADHAPRPKRSLMTFWELSLVAYFRPAQIGNVAETFGGTFDAGAEWPRVMML